MITNAQLKELRSGMRASSAINAGKDRVEVVCVRDADGKLLSDYVAGMAEELLVLRGEILPQ